MPGTARERVRLDVDWDYVATLYTGGAPMAELRDLTGCCDATIMKRAMARGAPKRRQGRPSLGDRKVGLRWRRA